MKEVLQQYSQKGFTIAELLIVIVVIGILAAIVIVAYNGIQNSAYDSSIKSDLANTAKALELYKTENSTGLYPRNATDLNDMKTAGKYIIKVSSNAYNATNNNFIYYRGTTAGSSYALVARSKSGAQLFISSSSGSAGEYTGEWGGQATISRMLISDKVTAETGVATAQVSGHIG